MAERVRVLDSRAKNPDKVRAGRIGAELRWGPPRRLNLGDLNAQQREIVLALVDAQRQANQAIENTKAAAEGQVPATAVSSEPDHVRST